MRSWLQLRWPTVLEIEVAVIGSIVLVSYAQGLWSAIAMLVRWAYAVAA